MYSEWSNETSFEIFNGWEHDGRTIFFVNDGTSDIAIKTMNALCALIFDVNNSKRVEFKFYDTCATSGEHCSKASAYFSL